ncbi:hypothetical protein B5F76_07290 [Desulfovibrio sp. An276]|uniref:hypothetical protein n=1 Tax=Desulfovibrio sp. An276 TaxID=1965618 RepID=UPI000B39BFA1|nr:hypothetical protein [Desulfovibrio sp. An276]OUO52454.1 hypothetical protein B5F76_07290 [Desulfovibrio sp. An276]
MTSDQQEQLAEALDHLDQARAIFLELSETLMESSERDPEDEDEEDALALADQFENTTVTIEEIIASFEDLRDN